MRRLFENIQNTSILTSEAINKKKFEKGIGKIW